MCPESDAQAAKYFYVNFLSVKILVDTEVLSVGFWSSVFGIGSGVASGNGGEVIKSSLELLEEYRSSRRNAAMQAQMLAMLQQQEARVKAAEQRARDAEEENELYRILMELDAAIDELNDMYK